MTMYLIENTFELFGKVRIWAVDEHKKSTKRKVYNFILW